MSQPTNIIACIGDSLTSKGNGTINYPVRLEALQNRDTAVIAAGISGYETNQMISIWQNHIKGREGVNITGTKTLVLMGGVNDILRSSRDADAIVTNLKTVLDDAGANSWNCISLGVSPFANNASWTGAMQTEIDSVNSQMSAYNPGGYTYTYLDLYSLLEDPGTADFLAETTPDYRSVEAPLTPAAGDGLHFNDTASALVATQVNALL